MTRKKLEDARDVRETERLYSIEFEYGTKIQSVIDELTTLRDDAINKGAIPDTIVVEMETRYGYYDDRYNEWTLSYSRKETPKEIEKRVAKTLKERARAKERRALEKAEKEEAERKEYDRLKEKYGDA